MAEQRLPELQTTVRRQPVRRETKTRPPSLYRIYYNSIKARTEPRNNHVSPTPLLDGAYCNALLLAYWSARQKLNHVSSLFTSILSRCSIVVRV